MPTTPQAAIRVLYEDVKRKAAADLGGETTLTSLRRLAEWSLAFLEDECDQIRLISQVPGKEYSTYLREGVMARPANIDYFVTGPNTFGALWSQWVAGSASKDELSQVVYTAALAPCLAMELFDRNNKKGPATYFECFVGHLVAHFLGTEATRRIRIPILDRSVSLTMDFLFHLDEKHGVHLPVKMSTRERVVQAWAHQRLLDVSSGSMKYTGIMVVFSETKLDSRTRQVVEICVPDQWLAYQVALARMERIYYFDVPTRYAALTAAYGEHIRVQPIADLFLELDHVLGLER